MLRVLSLAAASRKQDPIMKLAVLQKRYIQTIMPFKFPFRKKMTSQSISQIYAAECIFCVEAVSLR